MTIRLDIEAFINERQVGREAKKIGEKFDAAGAEAGKRFTAGFSDEVVRNSPKVQKAIHGIQTATEKATEAAKAYERVRTSSKATDDQKERALNRWQQALRSEADAYRAAGTAAQGYYADIEKQSERAAKVSMDASRKRIKAMEDEAKARRKAAESQPSGLGGTLDQLTTLGRTGGQLFRGTAIMAAPIVLNEVVSAASALSGVLGLIPAATAMAATGIGTLTIGTQGFFDTLKDVGDTEKFVEGLSKLSPQAQQAALSIRELMPEFTNLRKVTQEALFQDVGLQFRQAFSQFKPIIQETTTGVASAFNEMFSGVTSQLMSPAGMQSISVLMHNITQSFQNLAPAAAPLTQAFADLSMVGSEFLPQIASGAANAAQSFSNFIAEASRSGQLQQWIQGGIDAVRELWPGIQALGGAFIKMGEDGAASMAKISAALEGIAAILPTVNTLLSEMAGGMGDAFGLIGMITGAAPGMGEAIAGAFELAIKVGASLLNPLAAIMNMVDLIRNPPGAGNLQAELEKRLAANKRQEIAGSGTGPIDNRPNLPNLPIPTTFGTGGAGGTGGENKLRTWLNPATQETMIWAPGVGWIPETDPRLPDSIRKDLPKGDQPPFNAPADQWAMDQVPLGQFQGLGPQGMNVPPADFSGMTPSEIWDAQSREQSAKIRVEETRMRLLELQADADSSEKELYTARNNVIEAERDYISQALDAYEKNQDRFKNLNEGMGQIGVALDDDLGISKGLAGIAENLVRFLGNLAFAPMMGRLSAIAQAPGQAQGGFGLIGQLGAQGAFGSQYTAAGQQAAAGAGGAAGPYASYGGAAGMADPNVNAMLNLAQAASGRTEYAPASDLINGLADCSGSISDLYEVLTTGQSTPGREFTTTNFANPAAAAKLGFLPGFQPGALNVGVNPYPGMAGHMAATLPNGVNFEGGGGTGGGALYGEGAKGALDPQFEQQYYLPIPQPQGYDRGGVVAPLGRISNPFDPRRRVGSDPYDRAGGEKGGQNKGRTGAWWTAPPPGGTIWDYLNPGRRGGQYTPKNPVNGLAASDTVPAMLTPGELVIPKDMAPAVAGMLGWPGFAGGGGIDEFGNPLTPGPAPGPTQIGSAVNAPGVAMGGAGGIGASDSTMAMAGMAAGALDVIAPGAGQAAQTAMKLANRAIQYGGQLAGIGVSGLMETFLPTGGSELANGGWLPRIVGGLAGAKPALPNVAGGKSGTGVDNAQPPLQPQQVLPGQGQAGPPGSGANISVEYNSIGQTEDRNGRDLAYHLEHGAQPPAMAAKPGQ